MKIIPIILGIKYGTMSQYLNLEHNPNTVYSFIPLNPRSSKTITTQNTIFQ